MKIRLLMLFVALMGISTCSYADAIYSILNGIHHLESLESSIEHNQTGMLQNQLTIESLMKQVNGSMTGSAGWGNYQFHDYQSYGESGRSWQNVLRLAESGRGSGALAETAKSLASQFPMDKNGFKNGATTATAQNYYILQSETLLATRAASQLDYDKVQEQIAYQQMLQQQIEHTKDLKGAIDLNNRIQVEANLIQLEILRQSALSNEQHSLTEQANLNGALSNVKFLRK